MHFVDVIVPISVPNLFTYSITEEEFKFLNIGYRVIVPFGNGKIYTALVVNIHTNLPTDYKTKDIISIVDEFPIVSVQQLELWNFISNYYMCNIGEVYAAAMPAMLLLQSETTIQLNLDIKIDPNSLSDQEFLVFEALQQQESLTIKEVQKILNKKTIVKQITSLIQKNIIRIAEEIIDKYKPKQIKCVKLSNDLIDNSDALKSVISNLKNSEKQRKLLLNYFQLVSANEPVQIKKLLDVSSISQAVLKSMVAKNIFEEYYIDIDRVIFEDVLPKAIELTEAQNQAFNEIKLSFNDHNTTLLHGVTASGKTEIYIKLIEEILQQNKQILYLLPEIALTTQLVSRLTAYFGNKVSVYHSKYSNSERVEVWNNVLNNSENAQVIIGVRSSIFLPFSNLGFVIVDEEHEQTFKQIDPSPRYHARDTAIVLAKIHQAKVLLGSATPSIETYYNATQKKYGKVTLQQRFNNSVLPNVQLIDLTEKYKRKQMIGHFSDTMLNAIRDRISVGEQVIILQNRRGFSPYIECNSCGEVPHCINCNVSLTYYRFANNLRCNYCSYTIPYLSNCLKCNTNEMSSKGFGTEQLEAELLEVFPKIHVARLDQDTTKGKYSLSQILNDFKDKNIDILVGTQMLAKGLDFDNVTLVCVPNADNMLNIPDFRAHERAFQLLVQVAGRAGRSDKVGEVIIQTYNPYHNIVQQVTTVDYISMYNEQLYERLNFKYPPYYKLIKLTLKDKEYQKLKNGSHWLFTALNNQLPNLTILGPEEPAINKVKNEYIRTILLKISNKEHLTNTKKTLQRVLKSFDTIGEYKSIKTSTNVDFY